MNTQYKYYLPCINHVLADAWVKWFCTIGKKFVTLIFVVFYRSAEVWFFNFSFFRKVFLGFKPYLDHRYVQERKCFFSNIRNSITLHQRKKKTKNTRQISKSSEFPGISSPSPIICLGIFIRAFHHTRLTLLIVSSQLRKKSYNYQIFFFASQGFFSAF